MIRKLENQDRKELKRILIATEHFNDEEIKIALELLDSYLEGEEDYKIYVYEENEKAAGYICFGRRPLTDGTHDLYWIAVDPNIQGKGIGRKLVMFMEEELKKENGYLVLVETSGKKNYEGERTFYERNGYKVQTVIRDFYRQSDDLVVFYNI